MLAYIYGCTKPGGREDSWSFLGGVFRFLVAVAGGQMGRCASQEKVTLIRCAHISSGRTVHREMAREGKERVTEPKRSMREEGETCAPVLKKGKPEKWLLHELPQ